MAKYLDETGLAALWTKIKALVTASKYTHPSYTAKTSGLYKVTVDSTGHVSATAAVAKADITALGIPDSNTTYGVATQSANGLMSSTDKTKLDGVETGANKYVHPSGPGYEHIPTGGTSGQYLTVKGDGLGEWKTPRSEILYGAETIPSCDAVYNYVATAKGEIQTLVASTYALKSDITGMYKYKGSVTDASKLPTSGRTTGDVYNIETASVYGGAGMNVAWNGSAWDALGEVFAITSLTSAEIDTICA